MIRERAVTLGPRFSVVLFIVLGATLLVSLMARTNGLTPELADAIKQHSSVSREQGSREWRDYRKKEVLRIDGGPDYVLYFPAGVLVADCGEIFVRDDGDLSIKKFSSSGEILGTYGGAEGQGPGEFTSVTDFLVDERNRIWMVDATNGRITVYTEDGTIDAIIPFRKPPYRLVTVANDRFVVMNEPVHASHLFTIYDLENNEARFVHEFGVLLKNQERDSLALDGWVSGKGTGPFVLAPLFAGYLASFDRSGSLRFMVETVESVGIPRMRRREDGTRIVRSDSRRSALTVSVDNGKVYVLSILKAGIRNIGALDVYSADDGSYLYSLRLPEPAKRVVVQEGFLYVMNESVVSKWTIEIG